MSRVLILTSPLMHGEDVRRAQRILRNKGYFVGAEDGVFGEITARACSEAKYKLGYATKNIKPSYGEWLEAYLTGGKKPTLLMRKRAADRAKKKTMGEKAVEIARSFIGVKEQPPGSNRVMFSEWYGIIGPWCAMFQTYVWVQAGSKAWERSRRWAYCPFILDDARSPSNPGITVITAKQAQAGDVVLFDWNHDGIADHVGLCTGPVDQNNNFSTIEGNTGLGEVAARVQNTNNVIAFIRVLN